MTTVLEDLTYILNKNREFCLKDIKAIFFLDPIEKTNIRKTIAQIQQQKPEIARLRVQLTDKRPHFAELYLVKLKDNNYVPLAIQNYFLN